MRFASFIAILFVSASKSICEKADEFGSNSYIENFIGTCLPKIEVDIGIIDEMLSEEPWENTDIANPSIKRHHSSIDLPSHEETTDLSDAFKCKKIKTAINFEVSKSNNVKSNEEDASFDLAQHVSTLSITDLVDELIQIENKIEPACFTALDTPDTTTQNSEIEFSHLIQELWSTEAMSLVFDEILNLNSSPINSFMNTIDVKKNCFLFLSYHCPNAFKNCDGYLVHPFANSFLRLVAQYLSNRKVFNVFFSRIREKLSSYKSLEEKKLKFLEFSNHMISYSILEFIHYIKETVNKAKAQKDEKSLFNITKLELFNSTEIESLSLDQIEKIFLQIIPDFSCTLGQIQSKLQAKKKRILSFLEIEDNGLNDALSLFCFLMFDFTASFYNFFVHSVDLQLLELSMGNDYLFTIDELIQLPELQMFKIFTIFLEFMISASSFSPLMDVCISGTDHSAFLKFSMAVIRFILSFFYSYIFKCKFTGTLDEETKDLALKHLKKLVDINMSVIFNEKPNSVFKAFRVFLEKYNKKGGNGETISLNEAFQILIPFFSEILRERK